VDEEINVTTEASGRPDRCEPARWRSPPDAVHAEELAARGRENHFDHPVGVADDLAAAVIAVFVFADDVRNICVFAFFFSFAHLGNLRDREDAGRKNRGIWSCSAGQKRGRSPAALLLYTDGVTEAMDLSETLYSDHRLAEFLATKRGSSPRQIISDLVGDVRHFAGEAPQSDDITALALLYFGTKKMRRRAGDKAQAREF
jgi:Stage II sporulation protein E (SpoIIE)